MRPCAIVPSHNHCSAIGDVVARLRETDLPVFVIDDGSDEPAASMIAALHAPERGVAVHRFPENRGKGVAVLEGFRQAVAAGFTHAVQVDADGQHDLDALPNLLALAALHPEALITGEPQYDDSIPAGRKFGRWITHFWVWIETLSFTIRDSMCGFRVYPLSSIDDLATSERIGRRMDFDTEIMVRLFWRGTPVYGVPVRVIYPPDNTSNFDLWRDNLRISFMHTRLVLGMLRRLPKLLTKRGSESRHWAVLAERGAYWGLMFCALTYRLLGRGGCRAILVPIVLWFFLSGAEQRRASRHFLGRVFGRPATWVECYCHFFSFAERALDTFIAWIGGIAPQAIRVSTADQLDLALKDERGALIVVSHLGNVEIARALLPEKMQSRMAVLVHTQHAANYNRVLREFRPQAALNLIQVSEIGPDTAIALKGRVEKGDWVVIAGDRTPLGESNRVSRASFLGASASFSQGPWILASLLGCPVYLLSCVKTDDHWQFALEPFSERVSMPRGQREAAIGSCVTRYASWLEDSARRAPFQWYNFFDFWA